MKKYIYILLCVVAFINVSCSDDELNSKDLLVFVRSQGGVSLDFVVGPTGEGASNVDLKLPLSLTREASVDVRAGLVIDESLVDTYNKTHGTLFNTFPAFSINISQSSVNISAGYLESKDSICVSISPTGLKGGEYLLPLMITGVDSSDKGIRASETASVLYYKIEVRIKYLANDMKPATGTLVESANWQMSATPESDAIGNLIDGDKTSYWRGQRKVENQIEVDMKEIHALKGINFYYEGGSHYYCPKQIQVYISEDGENWLDAGKAGAYVCSGYTNIKEMFGINFLGAISMRYFRLVPATGVPTYYVPQINEIEAIK